MLRFCLIAAVAVICGCGKPESPAPKALPPAFVPAPPPAAAAGGRGRREENKVLAWDSKAMKFTNDDAANSLVDTPYRKEWDYEV